MFRGAFTALVTPFHQENPNDEKGLFDENVFRDFIEWQIQEGINGLVPVGTTGESSTLTHQEHKDVIEICIDQAKKRVPVIAGAGSNSTQEAVEFAKHAESVKADAILVVTPYYNKPDQKGLYAHFATIAKAVSIPIIIYNIPGRSIVDMSAQTMGQLAHDFKNIIGVKDATGKLDRVSEQREKCSKAFVQLSGDDGSALAFNAQGGVGCISVVSNIAPSLCAQMQEASLSGDYQKALEIQDKLAPLCRALFVEPSPAGVKYAAQCLGKVPEFTRKPIMPLEESTKTLIKDAMRFAGIIG